jgi:hypothetical protein
MVSKLYKTSLFYFSQIFRFFVLELECFEEKSKILATQSPAEVNFLLPNFIVI